MSLGRTLDPTAADTFIAKLQPDGQGGYIWQTEFSATEGFTPGTLNGQDAWTAAQAEVTAGETVIFTDELAESSMDRFVGAAGIPSVWLSFRAKLTPGELPESIDDDALPLSLAFGYSSEETLSVYDIEDGWIDFPANAQAGEWNDYAVHLDYTTGRAMLLINGQLIARDLNFLNRRGSTLTRLRLLQEALQESAEQPTDASELDAITIATAEPADLDFSGDGMTNDEKRAFGLDPWLNDNSGDTLPDVWKVAYGLDPLEQHDPDSDPDGDGLTLAMEAAFNADPGEWDDKLPGVVMRELWSGLPGSEIAALTNTQAYPEAPGERTLLQSLETPEDSGFRYGSRIRGYLTPPVSGEYTFYIAANDQGELWLSPNESPFDRSRVARTTVPTQYRNFSRFAMQASSAIYLEAGEYYYFEVLHKEDVGGDHLSVAWQGPDTDGISVIGADALAYFAPRAEDGLGDGLPDAWQIANGLDAEVGHGVHGSYGDFDADGIINLVEYQLGTDPTQADSDSDGLSDYEEVYELLTDPLVQDVSLETGVVAASASSYTAATGSWTTSGDAVFSRDVRGSLSYAITLDTSGAYRLELDVSQQNEFSSAEFFRIQILVDGESVGVKDIPAVSGAAEKALYYLPYLTAGEHTVTVKWINGHAQSSLRIEAINFSRITGPDADSSGHADYLELRADEYFYFDPIPSEIYVSPFNLRGGSLSPEALSLTSHPQDDPAQVREESAARALHRRFYADVELDATGARVIDAVDQHGLAELSVSVNWASFNLVEHVAYDVRLDDSMLLTAFDPADPNLRNVSLTVTDPDSVSTHHNMDTETDVQQQFDAAGTWIVSAEIDREAGEDPLLVQTEIVVHSANLLPEPVVVSKKVRDWQPGLSSSGIEVLSDPEIRLMETTPPGASERRFGLEADAITSGRILATLPGNGAVLSATGVTVLENYIRSQARHQVVETFSDGSRLVSGYIQLSEIPEGLSVRIHIFKSGVTFDDGTVNRTITADDFDEMGRYMYMMLQSPNASGGSCHQVKILHDGEVLDQM